MRRGREARAARRVWARRGAAHSLPLIAGHRPEAYCVRSLGSHPPYALQAAIRAGAGAKHTWQDGHQV